MKVCFLNTLYPPLQVGGAERSVHLLAEAVRRAGDDVVVITLHDGPDTSSSTSPSGIRIWRLPLDNLYWPYSLDEERPGALRRLGWHIRNIHNAKSARRVGEILDRERPDVLHANVITGFSPSAWGAATRRGIPIVQTLRDYGLICSRSALFRDGRLCEPRCMDCKLLTAPNAGRSNQVAAVVSNSAYVLDAHTRNGLFDHAPRHVVFNIADAIGVSGDARPDEAVEPSLVFGYIGRIEPEKGIEIVLAATQRLQAANWRLRIAGQGRPGYVDHLKARFPDPRIEWLGFTPTSEFFTSIDVALIASIWPEPLPRTLIECYAYGCSAICARSGGIPEIAGLGRVHAEYEPTDVAALADLMDLAAADIPHWRAGGFADAECLEQFSEKAITARYRDIYAEAVSADCQCRR